MPRLSMETRRQFFTLRERGLSVAEVQKRLAEEEIFVSRVALYKLWKKYRDTDRIAGTRKPKRVKKLGEEQLVAIDEALADNDELMARQLLGIIETRWPGLEVSISTVKRARKDLGWTATRPKYCQLVREVNRQKRLAWSRQMLEDKEDFSDVIWSDECTVQLDNHGRLCFRKAKQPRKLKGRAKHPIKVHIWGGISRRGATQIVVFTGVMTAIRYCTILEAGLLPFIKSVFPDSHRFQQDNDPKHSSRYTQEFLQEKNVFWWATPPESPDLNPIENVWGSLKYFLRHQWKPRDMDTLVEGIQWFWRSLTPPVCQRYIEHLYTVMPKVVEVEGAASGY